MHNPPSTTIAHAPIEVRWMSGVSFEAGRHDGPKVRIDGDAETAPSPFDVLLAAIASCASVDVVTATNADPVARRARGVGSR